MIIPRNKGMKTAGHWSKEGQYPAVSLKKNVDRDIFLDLLKINWFFSLSRNGTLIVVTQNFRYGFFID